MYKLLLFTVFWILTLRIVAQEINHPHSIHHAFIENKGQWDDQILFKSHFDGGNLWVQQHKLLFHLQDYSGTHTVHANFKEPKGIFDRQTVVHLNFLNSNEVSIIEKKYKTPNYYNYFLGNDHSKWASDVHGYGEATLKNIYDNIDLKLIEQKEQLKYEFHIQPDGDADQIIYEYAGHNELIIDREGNLITKTELGNILEEKPFAYQIVNGNIREVDCHFKIEGNTVRFVLGEYKPYVELVIDPVLIFATYSGSVTDNFGMTGTYAHDGTGYSGGTIFGNAYPTPDNSAYDISSNFTVANNGSTPTGYGVTDVFISHYSADGTNMIWTSFIGGGDNTQGTETVHSLICDSSNNVYLFGATSSLDFPIQGGYQTTHAGGSDSANFVQNGVFYKSNGTDIYVAKFSENGQTLLASTYMGGSKNDGINYKSTPNIYNVTIGAAPNQATYKAIYYNVTDYDSLVSNYGDQSRGEIMLDDAGNCIVASCSKSIDFPVQNAFQPNFGGKQDGVIFKLSPDLSTLLWSSYYGGSENDACYSVKVDSSQNIVFAGGTNSLDLPNINGWQTTHNGGKADGFVAKLNPAGSTVTYASYIGTSDTDQIYFCEIDRDDNVFLVGQSDGGNFPVINAPFVNPGSGQFVIKLDPTLSTNMNSTVFGSGSGTPDISPAAFLVDLCGNVYVSGWGANLLQSVDSLDGMPVTPDAYISTPSNGFDFYLIVIEHDMTGLLYASYMGGNQSREHVDGGTSRFDKNGIVYQSVCGGCGGFSDFPTYPNPAWSNINESPNCNNLLFKFDFQLIPKAEFTTDETIGCSEFEVSFDNFSSPGDSYLWDFGNGDTSTVDFNPTVVFDNVGTYQVFLYVTDSVCLLTDTAQITITVTDSIRLNVPGDQWLCKTQPVSFTADSEGSGDYFIWSSDANFSDTLNVAITDSVLNITPDQSTTYYVKCGNTGCFKTDSVRINFVSTELKMKADENICAGELSHVSIVSNHSELSITDFSWSPDSLITGSINLSSVDVNPSVSQFIYVTVNTNLGCTIDDSIQILVSDIPGGMVVASTSDNLVAAGETVTISATPDGMTYHWSPDYGLSNSQAQNTEAEITETIVYTLFVSDGICTKSDTVLITVFEYDCDEPTYFLPNAFSPNGDGENDILYVRGPIQEMTFRIFDRWGEMVFESFDRGHGWDGTFRGKPMDPDVYDYYLKVKCFNDQEAVIKGNITLIK